MLSSAGIGVRLCPATTILSPAIHRLNTSAARSESHKPSNNPPARSTINRDAEAMEIPRLAISATAYPVAATA